MVSHKQLLRRKTVPLRLHRIETLKQSTTKIGRKRIRCLPEPSSSSQVSSLSINEEVDVKRKGWFEKEEETIVVGKGKGVVTKQPTNA